MSCQQDPKPPNCKEFRPKPASEPEEVEPCEEEKKGFLKEIELPRFIRNYGPRQTEAAKSLLPGVLFYSLATVLYTIYFCDWQPVCRRIPIYKGKWNEADSKNA